MSDTIANTRALLRIFAQTDYRDMYLRSGDYALFVSRRDGGDNPMRRAVPAVGALAPVASAPVSSELPTQSTVTAPHIASLVSAVDIGTMVGVGDPVARIMVLDDYIDITADFAGLVGAVMAEPGQLLEYGTPICTMITPS